MNSNFNSLPKVELHVHLDCCLSYKALKKINPKISYDDFHLYNGQEAVLARVGAISIFTNYTIFIFVVRELKFTFSVC